MRGGIVGLLALAALAGPAAGTDDIAPPILAAHNAERRAVGVADLTWSATLAAHAAVWAKHLAGLGRLEHAPDSDNPDEGENLWMGTAGAYAPQAMVAGWSGEKTDFRAGIFPDVSKHHDWHAVGHYTQMIWKNTTEVGCATAASAQWDILVCRYAPPGNMIGEPPY